MFDCNNSENGKRTVFLLSEKFNKFMVFDFFMVFVCLPVFLLSCFTFLFTVYININFYETGLAANSLKTN